MAKRAVTQHPSVVVLGARRDSGNIGAAIVDNMMDHGWTVRDDDCFNTEVADYRIPDLPYDSYDALVVTLGKEGIQPWLDVDFEDVAAVVTANLLLPLAAMHVWAQARAQAGLGGTCVCIGSYAYDHSPTSCVPYCAAKAGLAHAITSLGWELTDQGFYWHIVHPYHVPSTPMGQRVVQAMVRERGFTRGQAEDYQKKDMKLPAHLTPTEIAEYVGWLVRAPEACWLSGQGLQLYGGVR